MEITDLKQMTKEEVFNFIRQRLSFSKELQEQFRHVNKDDLAKEHRRSKCPEMNQRQANARFSTQRF